MRDFFLVIENDRYLADVEGVGSVVFGLHNVRNSVQHKAFRVFDRLSLIYGLDSQRKEAKKCLKAFSYSFVGSAGILNIATRGV